MHVNFYVMEGTVHDRISQIIDNEYNGVKAEFCKKIGIKEGTLFSMFRKNTNPSFDLIRGILEKNREVDPLWLILGEERKVVNEEAEKLKEELERAQQEIAYLKEINELLRGNKKD